MSSRLATLLRKARRSSEREAHAAEVREHVRAASETARANFLAGLAAARPSSTELPRAFAAGALVGAIGGALVGAVAAAAAF